MITDELKRLVKNEAELLKKYATDEELLRLDFDKLSPHDPQLCIYGQMTGDCYRGRATKLLNLCTKPYSYRVGEYVESEDNSFEKFVRDFSPIELYISLDGARNKELISYLKDETNTLEI